MSLIDDAGMAERGADGRGQSGGGGPHGAGCTSALATRCRRTWRPSRPPHAEHALRPTDRRPARRARQSTGPHNHRALTAHGHRDLRPRASGRDRPEADRAVARGSTGRTVSIRRSPPSPFLPPNDGNSPAKLQNVRGNSSGVRRSDNSRRKVQIGRADSCATCLARPGLYRLQCWVRCNVGAVLSRLNPAAPATPDIAFHREYPPHTASTPPGSGCAQLSRRRVQSWRRVRPTGAECCLRRIRRCCHRG